MNFHWPSFLRSKPHTEVADLRDRAIVAETKAVLLENALEAERRRRFRERRRDASDVSHAIAARAADYAKRFGKLDKGVKDRAIEAAKRGRG